MTDTSTFREVEAKVHGRLAAANNRRSATAATTTIPPVRAALEHLDATGLAKRDVLRRMVAAGRLRLAHPDATLAQLAERSDPPMSKDMYAGLLRRLVTRYGA
jgi:DNA-binding transcriptional regulator WhiA